MYIEAIYMCNCSRIKASESKQLSLPFALLGTDSIDLLLLIKSFDSANDIFAS